MSGTRIDLYKIDYRIIIISALFIIIYHNHNHCFRLCSLLFLCSPCACGSIIVHSVSLLLFVFRVRERTLFDRLRWLLNRRGRRFFVSFYRLRFDGFATMVGLCISGWAGTLGATGAVFVIFGGTSLTACFSSSSISSSVMPSNGLIKGGCC